MSTYKSQIECDSPLTLSLLPVRRSRPLPSHRLRHILRYRRAEYNFERQVCFQTQHECADSSFPGTITMSLNQNQLNAHNHIHLHFSGSPPSQVPLMSTQSTANSDDLMEVVTHYTESSFRTSFTMKKTFDTNEILTEAAPRVLQMLRENLPHLDIKINTDERTWLGAVRGSLSIGTSIFNRSVWHTYNSVFYRASCACPRRRSVQALDPPCKC